MVALVLTLALAGCGSEDAAPGGETAEVLRPAPPAGPFKADASPAARQVAAAVAKRERREGRIVRAGCARAVPGGGYLAWECRLDFARGPSMRCRAPDINRYGVLEVLSCRRR